MTDDTVLVESSSSAVPEHHTGVDASDSSTVTTTGTPLDEQFLDLTFVAPDGLTCFLFHSPSIESLYGLHRQVLTLVSGFAHHTNVDLYVKGSEGEKE